MNPPLNIARIPARSAADFVPGWERTFFHLAIDVALLHPGLGFNLLELQQDLGDAQLRP